MSIQTILRDIQFAVDKPFREGSFPLPDFLPALVPNELACLPRPKLRRLLDRFAIHPAVLIKAFDSRLLGKILRRLEDALLLQVRLDVLVVDLHFESERTLTIDACPLNPNLSPRRSRRNTKKIKRTAFVSFVALF